MWLRLLVASSSSAPFSCLLAILCRIHSLIYRKWASKLIKRQSTLSSSQVCFSRPILFYKSEIGWSMQARSLRWAESRRGQWCALHYSLSQFQRVQRGCSVYLLSEYWSLCHRDQTVKSHHRPPRMASIRRSSSKNRPLWIHQGCRCIQVALLAPPCYWSP